MSAAPELQHGSEQEPSKTITLDRRNIQERIFDTHTPELIIGLCGPIGTDIHFLANELESTIRTVYDYETHIIRLSDIIREYGKPDISGDKFKKTQALIEAGNKLRSENGNSVLAELAIQKIALNRERLRATDNSNNYASRTCYVIDSIKNDEELDLFRLIYGNIFYFVGVFSNVEERAKNLTNSGMKTSDVHTLFDRDSGEELAHGQKVGDTFVKADFFLRINDSTSKSISAKIARFFDLIFNTDIITPTCDETAMYHAFAAASNSACLSRQVGASITNSKGEILSVGWNDVPKAGGGVYTFSNSDQLGDGDRRCMNIQGGKCFNDSEKQIIRDALVEQLVQAGLVAEEKRESAIEVIRSSRIKELIEFSRAVHAEMHAIIIGSQKAGHEVIGGKLYCTTYPCHNCARHIVASGIKEVYYIEPYRKSLATKLHYDSITENENEKDEKLKVLMFDGVSPRRYLEFFTMVPNSRKKDGEKKKYNKKDELPKSQVSLSAIPILEKKIIEDLQGKKLINLDAS
jgi:deoxycytidylate deaminase